MKYIFNVCVFLIFSGSLFGQIQKVDTLLQSDSLKIGLKADTLRIAQNDSTIVVKHDSVTIVNLDKKKLTNQIDSQIKQKTDSLAKIAPNELTTIPEIKVFKPDPKKAVIYSVIFPGLGQIYNRKYWKLPILYGGFIGFAYAITWNNSHYQDYMKGYIDIVDDDPNTNSWEKFVPYGQTAESVDKTWLTTALKDKKNYFRYYRDFSIIGTVALYGLAIVDAYVDAQLFDFDLSPDLSMRIEPAILKRNNSGFLGNAYGVQWSINF